MTIKDLLVISGLPGVFKHISQNRTGIIVENLQDGSRKVVSISAKLSMLSDIAIYTDEDDTPLSQVFKNIQDLENGNACPLSSKSSSDELRNYFAKVLPNFDRDRVYTSDIKKVINWYNALLAIGVTDFNPEPEKAAENEAEKR